MTDIAPVLDHAVFDALVEEIDIDGVRATAFFGQNPIMGDTREIWFTHGGYLFEVETYWFLDGWLAGIMKTWRFL